MKRIQKHAIVIIVLFTVMACFLYYIVGPDSLFAAPILNSAHNLSTSGTYPVRSTNESRICIFCHTPHTSILSGVAGIDYPLWNHTLSVQSYSVPNNTQPAWATMKSSPPTQPDGDSKLCLSCHDGTVGIASVVNLSGPINMQNAPGGLMPPGPGNLGTDLSGHHPVSIAVNQDLVDDKWTQCVNLEVSMQLCNPPGVSDVKLRPTSNQYNGNPGFSIGGSYRGGIQCTSCHDPHSDPTPDPTRTNPNRTVFLRAGANRASSTVLCTVCHVLCSSSCP